MSTPKISVIIPVYNTAKYLDECMASVLGQTMQDIEIILVDDGSTDGISPKMCDDYAKKDSRVVVIHKENGGLTSTWIEGTKRASAAYVNYLDSDDWVDTNMLEELYKHTSEYKASSKDFSLPTDAEISKNDACKNSNDASIINFIDSEIISSNYIVEKAGERRKETQALFPGEYTGSELDKVRRQLLGEEIRPVTMSRCMKLISKKLILDNIKYCNTKIKMSEDVNITLPCLCDCQRLVIVKDGYFYHYRLVGDSMIHGYDPHLMDNLELTDKTYRHILEDKKIENGNLQLDKEYIMILLLVLKNELRCQEKDTIKRVKAIFLRSDVRSKILNTAVSISSKSNKLLYFCMRHPNAVTISVTKKILLTYDKKTN